MSPPFGALLPEPFNTRSLEISIRMPSLRHRSNLTTLQPRTHACGPNTETPVTLYKTGT